MQEQTTKNKLINVKKASELLDINPATLRRWDKLGKLIAKRHPINNYRFYNVMDIEALKEKINAK